MIKGYYYDGKTSDKKEVFLYVNESDKICIKGIDHAPIPFEQIKVSSRIGNTARYIEFPSGEQFETDDNDAIDEIVKRLSENKFHGLAHALESSKRFIIVAVVFVVLFSWGFIQYGVPYFSKEIAEMLPDDASQYLGQGILEAMDESWFKKSELTDVKKDELTKEFQFLLAQLGYDNIKLEFRKSPVIGANAFALPNGTVVFTDELIELSNNNNEIVSIMLHELGHLEHKHSLRATIQKFSLAMFVMVITGDVSTSSSIVTSIPVLLVEAGYSQDMETEADTYALNSMRKLDINPIYFAKIMQKLEASHSEIFAECRQNSKSSLNDCLESAVKRNREQDAKEKSVMHYFSTHPVTQERIERFRAHEK